MSQLDTNSSFWSEAILKKKFIENTLQYFEKQIPQKRFVKEEE